MDRRRALAIKGPPMRDTPWAIDSSRTTFRGSRYATLCCQNWGISSIGRTCAVRAAASLRRSGLACIGNVSRNRRPL